MYISHDTLAIRVDTVTMRIQSILLLLAATASFVSSLELRRGRELADINKKRPRHDDVNEEFQGIEVVPMTDSPPLPPSRPCCCECTAPPCECSCKKPMDTRKGGYINISEIIALNAFFVRRASERKGRSRKEAKRFRKRTSSRRG